MMPQRTFEASHLKEYLQSTEGIHKMFEQLGYQVYDPEPLSVDDLDMNEADAQHIQSVYLINEMDFGHAIWLFEVTDTTSVRLRGLAFDLLQRGGTHTLIVTKDYQEIIIAHPYFVGGTSKSHTRINKLKIDRRHPTRHDVDTINALHAHNRQAEDVYQSQIDAFNVTRVTNKFYKEYRERFFDVQEIVKTWNKGIPEFQDSDKHDKLHAFVQRLMGRLMFLYFLQRKGWLGGQNDFLTRQYRHMLNRHAGELSETSSFYYREVLEPLFFDTLNKKRPDNWTQWKVEIPYLNGGLFDRNRDPQGIITLPDSLFDPNSNTGLLAFFNRYNFTITDDTPLEQDVAVDPEMLGKVFENMLEDRGDSGSFYTPRTIVSYMCQESLAGYLEESASIPREETRRHFDPDDEIMFTTEQAQRVSDALDTLTVLDPAVGSGSFLIGMMNEIITLRQKISSALAQAIPPQTIAEWKEAIIRDTLYGVDIKAGAIEIAQLRLWLSLIVTQTLADVKPLPNLDYKLMAGNSLIETIDGQPILTESAQKILNTQVTPQQPSLFDYTDAGAHTRTLKNLREDYFNAPPDERKTLSADIRFQERRIIQAGLDDMLEKVTTSIKWFEEKYRNTGYAWSTRDSKKYAELLKKQAQLETLKRDLWDDDATLPFFLYRLYFNDVFQSKGGFDVVVANPPYVRQELISDQKPDLKASYPEVYAGTADLFVYFFARAVSLLKQGGQLAFITPNKFMRANYGQALRGFLSGQIRLHTLIDFGDLPIFDATAYPMITIASNQPAGANTIKALEITELEESQRLHQIVQSAYDLPQNTLSKEGWQLTPPKIRALMNKIKASGVTLETYVDGKIYYGIKTGLNEAFIIDEAKRAELIAQDPKSAEIIKPYLRGRDVKRWRTHWAGLYILFIRQRTDITQYPAVLEHLQKYKERLENRGNNRIWYSIQPSLSYIEVVEQPKIIYQRFQVKSTFAMDNTSLYANDATWMIPIEDYFLLTILNSDIGWYQITKYCTAIQNGYQLIWDYLKQLTIPNAPDPLRQQIADLAQQCLDVAKDAPDKLPALEEQLNQLVYQAYGLDAEDVEVIEGAVGKS